MSGEDDDKPSQEVEFDLDDLGWDDALAELEDELDDAEKGDAHLSEARPLYRPPSPDDRFAQRPPSPPRAAPKPPPPRREPRRAPSLDDLPTFDMVDDDDSFASTKIAEIPQELINSLVKDPERARSTRPPPLPDERAGAELPADGPPSVDLDLDGLLDGLDDETALYPAASAPAPAPGRLAGSDAEATFFGARPPSGVGPAIRSSRPPAPPPAVDGGPIDEDVFDPFGEDDADEPTRIAAEAFDDAPDDADQPTRIAAEAFDDADEPTRVAAEAFDDALDGSAATAPSPTSTAPVVEEPTRMITAPSLAELTSDPEASRPPSEKPPAAEEPTRMIPAPSLAELAGETAVRDEPAEPTAGPEAAESDAAEPGAAEPGAAEPRAAQPEAAQPGAAEPRAAEPEAAQPEPTSEERALAIPRPSIPKPGAPRPSIPRPSIPRPGALGRSPIAGTRPKLPPIPKPGGRPSIPRPNIPPPARPSSPGAPQGSASSEEERGSLPGLPARPKKTFPPRPTGEARAPETDAATDAVAPAAMPLDAMPLDAMPLDAMPLDATPLDEMPAEASIEASVDAPPGPAETAAETPMEAASPVDAGPHEGRLPKRTLMGTGPAAEPAPEAVSDAVTLDVMDPLAELTPSAELQLERTTPGEQAQAPAAPSVDDDLDALLSADRARDAESASEELEISVSDAEPLDAPRAGDDATAADDGEEAVSSDDAPNANDLAPGDLIERADDDAPALVAAQPDDDDDVELAIGEDDEDDLSIEAAAEVDLAVGDDDWDDEDWAAIEAAEAEADAAAAAAAAADAASAPAANDRGAVAARRTVRSRKPRDERFPLIGDGPEALRLRLRLLKSLAENRQGQVRARLLVGAAELAEQTGDADEARELYVQALASDPTDLVALRALRRDAVARGEWSKLATLYEREAKLELGPDARATAWTALAELHLGRLDDPTAAEAAALAALEAQPSSVTAALLLAEARWRRGEDARAVEPFEESRELWDDPDARAALAVEEARVAEAAGDEGRARALYTWANDVDPEALDAWFGRARTSSRPGADPDGAIEALATVAAYCGGPLGEAILTRASRVATRIKKDPQLGVRLLGDATGVLPLQARADAAVASGDPALELACLAAWAGAAGGTDRALALVRTAETKAGQGDLDGAEAALRDAARADGSLGTIRVVREVIARRSGDMSRLADAVDGGGALAAAARVARDPAALEREHELLLEAVAEGTALVTADVLGLDVSAAQADESGITDALRRQADRVPPEQRTGSLLALTDRAIERDELDRAEALLDEARKLAPGEPLALRPLGRLALRHGAEAAAAHWLEEAAASQGARAAFATTQAGHLLAAGGGDALGTYRKALDAVPGYRPAAWALRPIAMELGDPLTLGEVYEQLADTAADPRDAAASLVRGALLRAEADPAGAAALLERAHEHTPGDMVIASLRMRLASESDAAGRAKLLTEASGRASAPLSRVYRLQAAQAYLDADDPASAAREYAAQLEATPDDPLVPEPLDRAQLAADQVARVAERRFAAVKAASTDEERTLALERLAELDLLYRADPASAVLSLEAILEHAPGHLPSLRALHRYYASQGRGEDAARVVAAHASQLEPGSDVTAYLRLARRLMLTGEEATPEASDALLVACAERADMDLWLAPRILAAALEAGEPEIARHAARALANLLGSAEERAASRMRASELLAPVDEDGALDLLREAVHASPSHPLAAAALGEACEARGELAEAAEAYEKAGAGSEVAGRAAALYYRAAQIWQDHVGDEGRAREALTRASEQDVTFKDVFERLRIILEDADDKAALAELYQHRLSAGGDDPTLVELYIKQAELRSAISDLSGAKAALRAALALQPERIDALRSLANLSLEDEDWRGAAEVLIRIARIRKEREELRWVFFTLGDIYDQHMPDPRRAEAAFRRVLKLFPNDLPAMERLAELYRRQNQLPEAAKVLEELAGREVDLEASRDHRLRLSEIHEQLGDARRAEAVLEEARKAAPTDLQVVRALAEFYRRQDAANAMAMHLRRAVNDFRHVLEADLADAAAWPGLVEVLRWQGKPDAAAAAASAAQAVGIVDIELSKLVDARGAAPGAGMGAASDALDELLAPKELGAPARAVFKLVGEALEKTLPFDVNAYRAERLDSRDTRIRPIALEVARWFRISPLELYVTSAAPRVCVPVSSSPCTLLIGSELLGITDDREKMFVLARALKIAQAQLSVVAGSQKQEVVALLGGLVQSYDPHHQPVGADPSHVAEAARRVSRNLSRRDAEQLEPLVFEMAGRPGYDPGQLAMAASEWGNRCALVASGSAPAAVSALAKLSGERDLPAEPAARMAFLERFAEASSLLTFALSDAHFEARERAGTEG